jgi:Tfp pilus assembly protein PilV
MAHVRRLAFTLLGAAAIPAVALVTLTTVSAASPAKVHGGAPGVTVAYKHPCTPFAGCASATARLTSSAVVSAPVSRSHTHCSHGRAKPASQATMSQISTIPKISKSSAIFVLASVSR